MNAIFPAVAAALLLGLSPARAAEPLPTLHGPRLAALEVAQAESLFSARFMEVGVAKGMQEFLDPDHGLAFTGGAPLGAAAVYAAMGGEGGRAVKLSWTPAEIWVAASGELAASWGVFRLLTPGAAKPATGRYVTVWRRGETGRWSALMDIGAPDVAQAP